MKRITLLLCGLTLAQVWAAPPPPTTSPYDLRGLTKDPGPNEPRHVLDPRMAMAATAPTRALPVAPRMIAEWEPVQGALIRYPLGIAVEAVKTLASELNVYVLATSSDQSSATSAFKAAGVNMANIAYITATTDTYWTRDYGAWWITTTEQGRRQVRPVDVVYRPNGVRPNDDRVPGVVATYFNLPTPFALTFVCQGGNIMTDAAFGGASTDRLRDENPGLGESELRQLAKDTVGLDPYVITQDPAYPSDYIKHIDCWAKFINPTTVLVKRVPVSSSLYSSYETAADLWKGRKNAAGVPYTVVRIDGPEAAPYVNHVILNDRVLVPVMKDATDPTDKAALDQIQTAYGSKFRIIGVKAAPGLPWLGTDSIHCRVNSIPDFNAIQDPAGPAALSFTLAPQSQTVTEGASVTFQATAAGGTPPYTYQWQRNGTAVSGATGATYTFKAALADQGATFKVQVTDSATPAHSLLSPGATLTVQPTSLPEKIQNGGFETGTAPWTGNVETLGNWSSVSQPAFEGSRAALLCGKGTRTTHQLVQALTLPAGTGSAQLTFQLKITTAEKTTKAYDTLQVQVRNSAGTVLKTLGTWSNMQAASTWIKGAFDLSTYRGQAIQVAFVATEDASLQTTFLLDAVSLVAP